MRFGVIKQSDPIKMNEYLKLGKQYGVHNYHTAY